MIIGPSCTTHLSSKNSEVSGRRLTVIHAKASSVPLQITDCLQREIAVHITVWGPQCIGDCGGIFTVINVAVFLSLTTVAIYAVVWSLLLWEFGFSSLWRVHILPCNPMYFGWSPPTFQKNVLYQSSSSKSYSYKPWRWIPVDFYQNLSYISYTFHFFCR